MNSVSTYTAVGAVVVCIALIPVMGYANMSSFSTYTGEPAALAVHAFPINSQSQTLGFSPSRQIFVVPDALKFNLLKNSWHQERSTSSSSSYISTRPAYLKIIAMGAEKAIPLIIEQLRAEAEQPDQWFAALSLLADQNPVSAEHRGDFVAMAKDWLTWYDMRNAG